MRNFTRHSKAGDYKPIPNCHCLNMVTAVIDFYKRNPKRLKVIFLNHRHWTIFIDDLKRVMEMTGGNDGFKIDAQQGVPIEGSDVVIKRGSQFQTKEMHYEFYNKVELKGIVHGKMAEA